MTSVAFQSLSAAVLQGAAPAEAAPVSGGPAWVVAANLVIWTGLFLYLLRIERRLGVDGRDARKEGTR